MRAARPWLIVLAALALGLVLPATRSAAKPTTVTAVKRGLEGLVAAKGGPPGAIATLRRAGSTIVGPSGRANLRTGRRPRASYRMRIGRVAKAFSGAVALH